MQYILDHREKCGKAFPAYTAKGCLKILYGEEIEFPASYPNTGARVQPTSITQSKNAAKLEIYPNPFQNYVEITNPQNEELEVKIADAAGRIEKISSLEKSANHLTRINTAELASGIYIIKISDAKGSIYKSDVFIKQ